MALREKNGTHGDGTQGSEIRYGRTNVLEPRSGTDGSNATSNPPHERERSLNVQCG